MEQDLNKILSPTTTSLKNGAGKSLDQTKPIKIALAGNPNSGKTSIFNALTGLRQHVGNYPGVTVEKREGEYKVGSTSCSVLDLPGTYSLNGYSPEEQIAQVELLKGGFDVVIAVIDSTTLNRSLVFVCQLMQLGANIVLCLNMSDEAKKSGQELDLKQFEKLLGFPIIETVAHRGIGMDALKAAVVKASATRAPQSRLVLGDRLTIAIKRITEKLSGNSSEVNAWLAMRLLLDDPATLQTLRAQGFDEAIKTAVKLRADIESETGQDVALFVMSQYYGFVDGLLREVITRQPVENARIVSDRIDSVLSHRLLGLPFFAIIMYAVFWITFKGGELPMDWIKAGAELLGKSISGLWPVGSDSILRSLLVDGIIAGVGGVIVFLPNILLLFMCLAFLEDTGYMARAAFLMDRMMHLFGLHGRSFIPLMSGFGCSVPAIMATRTLENERDRLTTMLVLPLMSCGARLPIWMLLVPAFFAAQHRAGILWLIYMIGIALAFVLAFLLRNTVLKGEDAPFVMELPPYRLPTLKAVFNRMVERAWLYLQKAGTIILAVSILMWVLTRYPQKQSFDIDAAVASGQVSGLTSEQIELRRNSESLVYSASGRVGHFIEPLIRPLGFDWKIGVGILGAFAAKEVFVAQMGVMYALGGDTKDTTDLQTALKGMYSTRVGFSLILFMLIATPCMATVAITRRESGRWGWAFLQFGGLTAIAYVISFSFYTISGFFV
ncbi:ferrous iron transport protein B [Bdellovibrionota bacterium FG-2]